MSKNNFVFKYNDINLNINNNSFISIVGNNNEEIYERAELEITYFDEKDVIATSDMSDPDPDDYEMII